MSKLLAASSSFDLNGKAPSSIQYIPAGVSVISAKVDGVPDEVQVIGDKQGAEILEAALQARLKNNVRPITDFDHEDSGPASSIPTGFRWQEPDAEGNGGIMLDLSWTGAGKSAVEAKDYSYFSPLFYVGEDGRPTGLHETRPIGGLVNDPAFRNIRRIAASNQPTNKPKDKPMQKHDFTPLVEANILTADQAKDPNVVALISAAFKAKEAKISTVEASNATLTKERDDALKTIKDGREVSAKAAVAKAVEAGRIGKDDKDSQDFWKDLILERGEVAEKQLENRPVVEASHNPLSTPIVKPGGAPKGQEVSAAHASKVGTRANAIMAESPGTSFQAAWAQAKAENPA